MMKGAGDSWLSVALIISIILYFNGSESSQDICGGYNGRRLYLELGARGVITAQNISLPSKKLSSNPSLTSSYNGSSHEQCTLELVTCPGCVVSVIFHHLNLSHQCSGVNSVIDSPCHCDYVWLSEPPYEDVSGAPFCGAHSSLPSEGPGSFTYKSQTRMLSVVFLYSEVHTNAFSFEYFTERNRQFLKGYPRDTNLPSVKGNISHGGVIKSPFFPALYPRDLGVEYIIACQPDLAVSCRVRILFHDFQVDVASIMEFYDWSGKRLEISTGSVFRPPVILSTGPSLMVRFYANGGTNLGYKATYSFLSGELLEKNIKPDTDCGGYVENLGGAITMMNMVTEGVKTYDCVWLIRPPKNYLHLKTHLFIKVSTFSDMAGNTELQILRGLTSEQPLLEMVRHPINQLLPHRHKEHIVPVDVGFYVSLRGTFGSASRLALVYATFSYSDCFSGTDTLCQNHRCIPSQLFCDGFDHCGDSSDEPSSCYPELKAGSGDRHWYSHTPNYYFPKMERYPDLKTATLIFIISCLGLILLIAALIVLLYRMGSRVRHQREIQNHLQTISDLLAANVVLDGGTTEDMNPDEPPVYEAPPDYDDVIKVFIDTSEVERRKLRSNSGNESVPTPSRPGMLAAFSDFDGLSSLEVSLAPTPEPTNIARALAESAPGLLSVTSSSRCATSTPAITSRSCQTTPIPDSPPPPYSNVDVSSGNSVDYIASATYAVSSPPTNLSIVSQNRTERSIRGSKLKKAWMISRDELVRNLQEAFSSNASVNNIGTNNSSANAVNIDVCDNSSALALNGNYQNNNNTEQSDTQNVQSTDVQFAYQLQNQANQIIDQHIQSCQNMLLVEKEKNSSCPNVGNILHQRRQPVSTGSSETNTYENTEFQMNNNGSTSSDSQTSLSTDSVFDCSCEGACGCATAIGNSKVISSRSLQEEPRQCVTGNGNHLPGSRSNGSRKSSVSSNLVWVSAESHDFL